MLCLRPQVLECKVTGAKEFRFILMADTVPTFNLCAKCVGSPAKYATVCLIATQFAGHGCTDDLTTERSLDSQATRFIAVLGLFFQHVTNECLYNQALEDVRSTGAGIKCLYCILSPAFSSALITKYFPFIQCLILN